MNRVAFVHGWAEGAWSASKFSRAFEEAGFEVTNDVRRTDIIISHSAGCYFVADYPAAKLVVLIGLPLWPGKPIIVSLLQKLFLEVLEHRRDKLLWYIKKLAHNTWDIATKPTSLFQFLINRRRQKLPITKTGQKIILIRNSNDRFSSPKACQQIARQNGYQLIEVAGLHDDCWINPEKYVEIVSKYAKRLA